MDQSDSNPTSHLPQDDDERTDQQDQPSKGISQLDTEFGDIDSNIELHLIDQQPPDDVAEASTLQPTAEDRYMGNIIAARTTLEEVRATLNQPEYTDCLKLRMFLPSLEAAKRNLSNIPSKLTQETIDEGKRVLEVLDIIHLAIAQLNEMKDISSSQSDTVRWLTEEYVEIVKENYENICIAEELVEDDLAEEGMILTLKENFLDSIAKCRDEMDHIHLTEVEEPSTSTASAAGGSHYSPGSSRQGAEKRKLNYLTSHSSDYSKRFCSGDTDADF